MKRVFVLLAVTAMTQLGFAQQTKPTENASQENSKMNHKGHGKKNWREKKKMMDELNLTNDQKAKMKEMKQVNKEKRQAILDDKSLTEDQRKNQLKDLNKTHHEAFKGILSDEQKEKMKTIKRQHKRGDGHRKGTLRKVEQPEKVISDTTNQ